MKSYLLFLLTLLFTGSVFAQQSFGIASFTIPAGWEMSNQTTSVLLENKQPKTGTCRIRIFKTEQAAVNSEKSYLLFRTSKSLETIDYKSSAGAVTRTEANGYISFMSAGEGNTNNTAVRSYFYSFTNNHSTFFVQLITDNNTCIGEFNRFLSSLKIEAAEAADERSLPGQKGTTTKSKAKRKKSAPSAAPAAPAPMM